ncbi:MAG TPA: hypothetical protein VID47_05010 [Actinomycetota bacterium]
MAVVAVAVVAGVVAIVASSGGSSTALPGLQTGPAPWPPEYADLRERLEALGLPAQAQMAATLHHHDLLQIFVEGRPVVVPANIGIDQEAGYLTSLHTHDASGIMHVESPTVRRFTLGQFFGVWGVRLTSTCIGGYCASGGRQLRAFVNGKPFSGAPGTIPLRQHDDIVLAYGNDAELPHPIPSSYSNSISPTCAPDC